MASVSLGSGFPTKPGLGGKLEWPRPMPGGKPGFLEGLGESTAIERGLRGRGEMLRLMMVAEEVEVRAMVGEVLTGVEDMRVEETGVVGEGENSGRASIFDMTGAAGRE